MYKEEGQRMSYELEVPLYLAHVDQRLNEERERLAHYLDPSTKYVYKMDTPAESEYTST